MVQSGDAVGHDLYTYEVVQLYQILHLKKMGVTQFMVVANMNNGIFQ